jgi:hypothetical protein
MKKKKGEASWSVPYGVRCDNRLYIEKAYTKDLRYVETMSDREQHYIL